MMTSFMLMDSSEEFMKIVLHWLIQKNMDENKSDGFAVKFVVV